MARDLQRTKPKDTEAGGGLDEFKSNSAPRERVTKGESPVVSGWSVDRRPPQTSGDKPNRFRVPDDGQEVLIKFVQDVPFASFFQHWVRGPQGSRAYVCVANENGYGCPLCDRGDRPKPNDWFNIVQLVSNDEDEQATLPAVRLWYATADPAKAIKERADTKRTSPINRDGLYFAVSKRTGKNGFNSYTVDPVKAEELEQDWGVEPLTDAQIRSFELYTADLVRVPTKSDLQAVADEHFKD